MNIDGFEPPDKDNVEEIANAYPSTCEIEKKVAIPFTSIGPEAVFKQEDAFVKSFDQIMVKRSMVGEQITLEYEIPEIKDPTRITIKDIVVSDSGMQAKICPENKKIQISGIPTTPGDVSIKLVYNLLTKLQGNIAKEHVFKILQVTPDPKTLWRNLPTDNHAPYQAVDEEHVIIQAGEHTIIAASKRGRSHAHDGKFRDDNFKVEYIDETGWFIIAVSDGAGSAKFSRAGSRIACQTFLDIMHEKLSSREVNVKIEQMAPAARENALKNAVLAAAYQGLSKIDAEAKSAVDKIPGVTRKDYSATFLGHIMKRIGDKWVVISMGIGDGIMGLLNQSCNLTLLSEPDGGEFVGQTRFITMNEVWQNNPIGRVRASTFDDFKVIMSMSDGVSDPKFETDNNLKNESLWIELYNDIAGQVPLGERSEETAHKLSDWLDFWSKGNHDDRTIVLVY